MKMKFSGICLISENVSRLVSFYEKVFNVKASGDDWHAELSLDGTGLAIFNTKGMEQMAPGSMQNAGYGNFTIVFEVDDADAEYKRLKTIPVEVVKPPQTHPWGSRAFWFRDPDGNIIDFYSVVPADTVKE